MVLCGILFVLYTGISGEFLPQELGFGSGMTCWRRLRDWHQAGVWQQLHEALLAELNAAGALDWSRAVIDSSHVRALPGVGEFTALVMMAEIGDITRFGSARKLASWAGLTPTVRGSDLTVRHGHIPRAGPGPAAVGAQPGRADRQAVPGLRCQLRGHRQTAREEDRHHRDRPRAGDPRLAPAFRDGTRRCQHAAAAAVRRRVAKPRVSSLLRHEPAPAPRSII
jgi:transposase